MTEKQLTVLMIDDDSLFSDVVGQRLRRDSIECVYAPSGAVALGLLSRNSHIDMILLDIRMPDMDGFTILRQLKKDAYTATIPVLLFSNDATEENIALGKELGAVQMMEKVRVTPGEIAETVHAIVGA